MGAKKTSSPESGEPLPPLSAGDFRTYNRMSEQMEAFVSLSYLSYGYQPTDSPEVVHSTLINIVNILIA